ncbi:hypothetical protein PDESU_01721 [Pontiella desulfatans]|uniref:Uncharacterized protein n=1 Tax=Pontiella desulfatans TaxID=2750659 RepID=A0A6C2TZW6_PONDE|nr:hypothetical protein [Pontiella desulfatans]VGO13167.1 hypothetical protein PDESU_01721 [Pontiella desulfatans]
MGFSTETRTRSLDTMPFGSSLQLDMEVWSGTECDMGYQVGTMWYGFKNTTSNRKPEPDEGLNIPPLPNMNEPEISANLFNGAVEFEEMELISGPKQLIRKPQHLKSYKGSWSETDHVLFKGMNVGDVVEFRIPGFGPPSEKLTLHATKSKDFGILSFSVNGKPAGSEVDLYAGIPMPSGAIELGFCEPIDESYILRVEVVGKNPKSTGALFGLDCVILK